MGGHRDVVGDLLESGVSVSAKSTEGCTPLHYWAAFTGDTMILQQLQHNGADKNAKGDNDETPLLIAATKGNLPAALALLAAGADVSHLCGRTRGSVVYVARLLGHVDILRAVIRHGADVDANDDADKTKSALHAAACHNRSETINVLVEAGADIEARSIVGTTPLHVAALSISLEAAVALLRHGARVSARTSCNETPLHYAEVKAGTHGSAEVVDLLLRRSGADETIVYDNGETAADIIGVRVEEENRLAVDFQRVRRLLANAPADRAWRRRGSLVLSRAHPDRVQLRLEKRSCVSHVGMAPRTRSRAKLAKADTSTRTGSEETTGCSTIDSAGVAVRVLRLPEEGIFRAIVGYL